MTRRPSRAGSVLGATLLVALFGGSAQARAVVVYDSDYWQVHLSSISTRGDGGDAAEFELAEFQTVSRGGGIGVFAAASEEWIPRKKDNSLHTPGSTDIRRGTELADDPVTGGVSAVNTTDVQIKCKKGAADFDAGIGAEGNLTVAFEDGFEYGRTEHGKVYWTPATALGAGTGSGYAKAGVGFRVQGDLSYAPTDPETGQAPVKDGIGLAHAAGQDPKIGGTFEAAGLSLPFEVLEGQGTVTIKPPAVGNDNTHVLKDVFQFKLQNRVFAELKADDSFLGAAYASAHASARHGANIRALGCADGDVRSRMDFQLAVETDPSVHPALASRNVAIVKVTTENTKTQQVLEDRTLRVAPVEGLFRRTQSELVKDQGWQDLPQAWVAQQRAIARPQRDSVDDASHASRAGSNSPVAHTSRRLGIKEGAVARYAVSARRGPLRAVRSMTFEVADADAKTGHVVLDGAVRFRDGTISRSRLPVEAFTGKGELRAILVSARLGLGQRVHGFGRVVRRSDEEVIVRYRVEGVGITAVYDRRSGWLTKMTSGNPRRPAVSISRVRADSGPVTAKSAR
jgi:hypothetical protein